MSTEPSVKPEAREAEAGDYAGLYGGGVRQVTGEGDGIYCACLLAFGRKERALEVARLNEQQHPEEKFWTYIGLARVYTAVGDKNNAIKNWETALLNVPAAQRSQIPAYENALKKLKESK